MTKLRRRELKRVRSIIYRAQKRGLLKGNLDISSISTRGLRQITNRRDLIRRGVLLNAEESARILKIRKTSNIRDARRNRHYTATGNTIPRQAVLDEGGAKEKMDLMLVITKYGENYTGMLSLKESTGALLVQKSSIRLTRIIEDARRKSSDEELVQKIEREWGSVEAFGRLLERLVLAIYDDVYATWAGGNDIYEAAVYRICEVLGAYDEGF